LFSEVWLQRLGDRPEASHHLQSALKWQAQLRVWNSEAVFRITLEKGFQYRQRVCATINQLKLRVEHRCSI
jgi:hypothetical protein